MQYEYDANGRMKRSVYINGGGRTLSVYDGLGQRVQTSTDGVTTHLVYDAFGRLATEYGGSPTQAAGGVSYQAQDAQGAVRVVTDTDGVAIAGRDYQPFGEEIPSAGTERANSWAMMVLVAFRSRCNPGI
jgi:YD repeat-containing protein